MEKIILVFVLFFGGEFNLALAWWHHLFTVSIIYEALLQFCVNGLSVHLAFYHNVNFFFRPLDLEKTQMVAVVWLSSSMVQLSSSMWRMAKLSTTCELWEDMHLDCFVKWKKMVRFNVKWHNFILCSSAIVIWEK